MGHPLRLHTRQSLRRAPFSSKNVFSLALKPDVPGPGVHPLQARLSRPTLVSGVTQARTPGKLHVSLSIKKGSARKMKSMDSTSEGTVTRLRKSSSSLLPDSFGGRQSNGRSVKPGLSRAELPSRILNNETRHLFSFIQYLLGTRRVRRCAEHRRHSGDRERPGSGRGGGPGVGNNQIAHSMM